MTKRKRGEEKIQRLGMIGLGKIGGNLALQAIEKNIKVVGMARSEKPELTRLGLKLLPMLKPLCLY